MEAADSPAGRARRRAEVKIAAVVLAAGSSSRLGRPKQLLQYRGSPLVRRAASAALDAGCDPVAVVIGPEREKIVAALHGLALQIVPNEVWFDGIGTSIRAGLTAVSESDAVVLLVCDQPKVDASLVRQLIARQAETSCPMVATHYAGTRGVPALFTRACFEQLLSLPDDSGAKALLEARPDEVATVEFPAAAWDIDTPEDLHPLAH
jgi:molybdenum cofactor cytidylyltransferase